LLDDAGSSGELLGGVEGVVNPRCADHQPGGDLTRRSPAGTGFRIESG
jgi:hypothetical protein